MNRTETLRERVVADYERKTPGSRALFQRAVKTLPGGVSGNLRFFPPYPLYMASGEGCRTAPPTSTLSPATAPSCSAIVIRP